MHTCSGLVGGQVFFGVPHFRFQSRNTSPLKDLYANRSFFFFFFFFFLVLRVEARAFAPSYIPVLFYLSLRDRVLLNH